MNVNHCCQMAKLVAEEMGFGQGWNSPSYTRYFKIMLGFVKQFSIGTGLFRPKKVALQILNWTVKTKNSPENQAH